MSEYWALRLGMPSLPMIVLQHPLAHLPIVELEGLGEASVDQVIAGLTGKGAA